MTADRRAALVKEVTDAMVRAMVEAVEPDVRAYEMTQDEWGHIATAAIDLIRAEVLEEAARVADRYEIPLCETSASHIAAAIRALKGGA